MARIAKAFNLGGNYWKAKEWILKAIKASPNSVEYRNIFTQSKNMIEFYENQNQKSLTGFLNKENEYDQDLSGKLDKQENKDQGEVLEEKNN